MKKSSFLALIGFLALGGALTSTGKAEMKVGTIDMQKVFTAYYKTHEAEDKLKDAQRAYKEELDQRMEAYKKNLDGINKLNEEINKILARRDRRIRKIEQGYAVQLLPLLDRKHQR